jgi:anaerobic ribonucleoside-triphosphate reductase activating protein
VKPINLKIGGLSAWSTTDFPDRLAAVVFVQGCPWRCSYCHNPHLQARGNPPDSPRWEDVRRFLQRRQGLLDAVVFSGGEPLIDPAIADAMRSARSMGFAVGLHTAGIYPRRFAQVLPLVDWVGLDIKSEFSDYAAITGISASALPAHESLRVLLSSHADYEVRTTVHPALISGQQLLRLAEQLAALGVKRYALQVFRPTGCASAVLEGLQAPLDPTLLLRLKQRFDSFCVRPS